MTEKLETRLLKYFLLIAAAAVMIGVEFYFEIERPGLTQEICTAAVHNSDTITGESNAPPPTTTLGHLRNKVVVMFGLLTLVVAIVLMMFIKNITMPLCRMAEVAERINQGDLSQVVEIESRDEIGQVGIAINELTSNLQEIASFTSTTGSAILKQLEVIADALKQNQNPDLVDIKSIQSDVESLVEFADSFELLQTAPNQ